MKLKDFFTHADITMVDFSKKTGICLRTFYNIYEGRDIKLSVALKIQKATHGIVKCEDLLDMNKLNYSVEKK